MDPIEACNLNNDPQPDQLKLQIRNYEDHSYQSDERGEPLVPITKLKKVRLGLELILPPQFPYRWKDKE